MMVILDTPIRRPCPVVDSVCVPTRIATCDGDVMKCTQCAAVITFRWL